VRRFRLAEQIAGARVHCFAQGYGRQQRAQPCSFRLNGRTAPTMDIRGRCGDARNRPIIQVNLFPRGVALLRRLIISRLLAAKMADAGGG
jgi:hypothetical protein